MNELRDVFTKYKAVVFFDTETTGLEAESCQIIELAAIRVEKKIGRASCRERVCLYV